MKKIELFFLFIILLGAFSVRLYKFNSPVADWHSWRQVDTSAVSRNFAENGFDLLHPRFEDLSMGVSLIDNPKGYRFVEFPIYNAAQAGLYKLVGKFTLEQWGRLVTIFSSLLSILFLYLLVRKYISITAAMFAAGFVAFVPYSIYYSRVILPDPSMVAMLLGSTYFFSSWIDTKMTKIYSPRFLLALLFMIMAILLKPYALFFTLPLLYLSFRKFGLGLFKKWQLWLFLIISIAPFIFWQLWMRQYPAGIPRNDWLFNGSGIRFKGAFFHWLFGERIGQFILGYFGLPFVVLGLLKKLNQKEGLFFFMFLFSSLIFMFTLATGNVQHDYYQILIIPTLAVFFGKGIDMIVNNFGGVFSKWIAVVTTIACIGFMMAFSWFVIRDFYNIQHPEIITAGNAVNKKTQKDAKIVAPYGGDTTLLYATGRNGWPVFDRPLSQFIKQGAKAMVFVNPAQSELNFKNYFAVLDEGKDYIIYDLTHPLKPIK